MKNLFLVLAVVFIFMGCGTDSTIASDISKSSSNTASETISQTVSQTTSSTISQTVKCAAIAGNQENSIYGVWKLVEMHSGGLTLTGNQFGQIEDGYILTIKLDTR